MPFFFKANPYFLPEAKAKRAAQAQQQKQLAEERVKADEEAFKAAKVPVFHFLSLFFSLYSLPANIYCFFARVCLQVLAACHTSLTHLRAHKRSLLYAQASAWKTKQQERKQALLERFARKQRAIARQRDASAAAAASSLAAPAGAIASSP